MAQYGHFGHVHADDGNTAAATLTTSTDGKRRELRVNSHTLWLDYISLRNSGAKSTVTARSTTVPIDRSSKSTINYS